MEIPVLIEPIQGNGYVARAGSPFDWSAEGHTAEEALQKLREEVARHLTGGTMVAPIRVSGTSPSGVSVTAGVVVQNLTPNSLPWHGWIGKWKPNDPLVREWRTAVDEHRREAENDPERL